MLSARRVLVTGANKGIGLALVRALATTDMEVIMTFRKGNNGVDEFQRLRKECPAARLHYHFLDITDQASREELARYIQKEFGSIDVLVNNAALGYDEPDKIPAKELAQSYIGCNFLATVALTELLLPLLAADGKIINVSSKLGALVHHSEQVRQLLRNEKLTRDELFEYAKNYIEGCSEGNLHGWSLSAYRTSKALLNAWSRFVLIRALKPNQSVLVVTPGFCKTDMVINYHNPQLVDAPQPKSPEEGIKTILFCIFEVPYDNSQTGQFFADSKLWNYERDR